MKYSLHAIFVCAACVAFFATPSEAQQNVSEPFPKRVSTSEFVIFPWGRMPVWEIENGPWGDFTDADDMMKDLYDCGYNTTGFVPAKYVPHAVKHNLKVIVHDWPNIYGNIDVTQEKADELMEKVFCEITDPKLREAVYAMWIIDEPHAGLFPLLDRWSKAVRKAAPSVIPYINLFPDYAGPETLGSKDYESHIDAFVETCSPPYISYDNYSLFTGGKLDEDRFFSNLETTRKASLKHGIPFWNVVLGNTHFHYAEPSDVTLRIQAYATLAYGGKGIGYFTHYSPPIGDYRLGPIDQYGHRTKTWDHMRQVNLQIHAIAPVYCKLKSVNVFHTGHVPRNAQGGIESSVHLSKIEGGTYVVGEFVDPEGNPFVMVVNKNMQSSALINIKFKKEGTVKMVSPYAPGIIPFGGEQHWLAPGAGILLTLEPREP